MTGPKAHGFLFKAAMILAILDRTKTQTRRAVTMHNSLIDGTGKGIRAQWKHLDWARAKPGRGPDPVWNVPCTREDHSDVVHQVYPRVRPGDSIYARETWAPHPLDNCDPPDRVLFKADGANYNTLGRGPENLDYPDWDPGKWRSPLHMRRDFARIVLPVTSVGAERVADISAADAMAEGLSMVGYSKLSPTELYSVNPAADPKKHYAPEGETYDTTRMCFRELWDSINGDRPGMAWKDSPPVWAYQWEPLS